MENNELSKVKAELASLQQKLDAMTAENVAQNGILEAVRGVANNSQGIAGWHLNGDIAGWDEILPEINDAETPATDAAINALREDAVKSHLASDEFQIDLAVAWARVDGLDDRDLDTVIWEGQPPEPMGSVFDWEYLPRAGQVIEKLRTAAQADKDAYHA